MQRVVLILHQNLYSGQEGGEEGERPKSGVRKRGSQTRVGGGAKSGGTQGRVRGNERPIEEGHGGREDKMRKFMKIDKDKETITKINTTSNCI